MTEQRSAAIYGVGSMGGAILDGLLSARDAHDPEVLAVVRRADQAAQLDSRDGVRAVGAEEAAAQADVHLVTVKPYDVLDLLRPLHDALRPGSVVVSLALGISLADLRGALPAGVAAVRGMPSTPARVGQGMTVLSVGDDVSDDQLDAVRTLLAPTGRSVVLPEGQQDVATALSGSAPAYFYLVVEALVDAGVAGGLPRATATDLAVQAALGAGSMMRESDLEPVLLRAQVTSPGGSTAAALRELEAGGLRETFARAVRACTDRSAGR
ncbi:pyrroline-5-carboxylate reductase [Janibacter melonis]|uniref:pyrroline-5-carboxylate reductase n=1 Tax=Janibacter melonis TaxID=262209 RepID=UPI002042ECEC|nr:pyrroline-5-carboxylate reductase [Janibacter melonis]MCM3554436.1 pyrroline-5-carboxylate reductase [Janibacter melonis]